MNSPLLSVLFDGFLAVLLMAVIVYCRILNTRLRVIQDSKSELAKFVREFDAATTRATETIVEIQKASQRINENITMKLEKANYLADDLTFLIEKATKISNGLRAGETTPRPTLRPAPPVAPKIEVETVTPPAETSGKLRSRAEKELLEALKNNSSA